MTYYKKTLYLALPIIIILNIAIYIYSLEIGNFIFWISIIGLVGLIFCNGSLDNRKNDDKFDSKLLDDEEVFIDSQKINPIKNIINAHQNIKFFSMALIGKWGSGKSSYLKTLQKELKQKHHIIYLNVWELEDSSNIISEVKKEFDNIIFKSNNKLWLINSLQNIFNKDYFGLLSKYFIKSEIRLPSFFEQTLKESKDKYNELLKSILLGKKIIIMIDEVDRLHEKNEILNIFKIIRYTASFDNVFVITAIDLEQIEKILKDDIEYIHKIFNIKHHIPSSSKNELAKYYKEIVFEKLKDFILPEEFEKLLLSQNIRAQASLLDLTPTFRVLKNGFNDTYSFVSSLQTTHEEDWKSYITFEFIFIMNILKASSYKDFHYLISQNNIDEVLQILKEKKIDELKDKSLEEKSITLLYFLLKSSHEIFFEPYLEIYKNYAILEYNISKKNYFSLVDNPENIEAKLKMLHIKEDKTKYLLDLIYYVYEDEANQYKMLKVVLELLAKYSELLESREVLELLVLRNSGVSTLVNSQNQELFLVLFPVQDLGYEFISLVFDNQKLMYFGKQIDYEVVLFLFEKYLESLHCKNIDDKELEEKLKELFLRNLTLANIDYYQREANKLNAVQKEELEFTNEVRKIIIDNCLECHKEVVVKIILESMPLESIKLFFEKYNFDINNLLEDNVKYQVKTLNEDESQSYKFMSGLEIIGKLHGEP